MRRHPVAAQLDEHAPRLGVARDVGERLLGDAEAAGFYRRRQPFGEISDLEIEFQPAALREPARVASQGRRQSEIVEDGRVQVQREIADLLEQVVDDIDALADLETG